jgi:hypothetical protein
MPTTIANRWEASPDGRLPPAPETFLLLLDDYPDQSAERLTQDFDVSRLLVVDGNPDIMISDGGNKNR